MKFSMFLLITWSLLACVVCTSYFFGKKTSETKLLIREKVIFFAIPWKKRVETYTYNDIMGREIKAIDCHDYQRSEATVNVTEGGVGFTHVTLRFKSQRSYGLEYGVEIFV
ncbi:uncharacterized protein LOC126369286 [Pectinophora gossypiella]|uniref:Salivary secreted peptide n=1 Tax=Pectinophora gossypiella TaxID=13191 RepID=A0A1E1WVM8_PECGO|nr:uncharacterized protein LOC126369286 [Pectinophora gossypiella]